MEIFECVPNISSGATTEVIDAIIPLLASSGVSLLHVDRGPGVNRTVLTMAGTYQEILKAALSLYDVALRRIDMRQHHGAHPRLGAVDVCPIIPLFNSSMDRAIELAREIGATVFDRYNLPIFFYEEAAYSPLHRQLSLVRRGEFEGLTKRADLPDLWSGEYHPSGGATVIGARKILIAYNITVEPNAESKDALAKTKQIAARLRSQITKCPETGMPIGGSLPHLRAIGWQLADTGELQLSCNLTDYTVTSMESVFKLANHLVQQLGWMISSSEVIGLCPAKALSAKITGLPSLEQLAQEAAPTQQPKRHTSRNGTAKVKTAYSKTAQVKAHLLAQLREVATDLKLKDFEPELKVLELVCAHQLKEKLGQ